ncbi:uncharacterized protein LOC110636185 [Hevea brasiliensis]|uniref:uncharacterized protein LOC110636185 n=1 Tax=Hevea brasiliensis TaxID=3981 RepID=UPI0025DBC910|nr:uncharacterized protein LOC110636185 [Hevea brasiliensis]
MARDKGKGKAKITTYSSSNSTDASIPASPPPQKDAPLIIGKPKEKTKKRTSEPVQEKGTKKKKISKAPVVHMERAIHEPRYIHWPAFVEISVPLQSLFEYQKWDKLCSDTEGVYVDLVQEFYKNLRVDDSEKDESFKVKMKGTIYEVTVARLAKALGIPNSGNKICSHKDVFAVGGFNKRDFEGEVFKGEVKDKTSITHAHQHIKILHSFIIYVLNPRTGSPNYLSTLDLCIIWHIVNQIEFNLAYFMLKQIMKWKPPYKLPYAHLLNGLFRDFGIPLETEKLRTNMIPVTSLQKDDDGRKLRFEQGASSKDSASGTFNVEGILEEVNNLREFVEMELGELQKFRNFQTILMNALDSKVDGSLMLMYKIVEELFKIKVHLGISTRNLEKPISKDGSGKDMSDSESEAEPETPAPAAPAKGKGKTAQQEQRRKQKEETGDLKLIESIPITQAIEGLHSFRNASPACRGYIRLPPLSSPVKIYLLGPVLMSRLRMHGVKL